MAIIDTRRRDRHTVFKATVLAIAICLCSGCGGGSSGSTGESAQAASILKALTGDGSAKVLAKPWPFAGLNRLTGLLPQSDGGIVILDEGNSDAYEGVTVANYRSALESAVGAIEDSG